MVPCLHCGYLYLWLITSKRIYLEHLSYIKKQREASRGTNKTISSKQSTVKACFYFLVAEVFSLCVPATPCSTTSTLRLTPLKGEEI